VPFWAERQRRWISHLSSELPDLVPRDDLLAAVSLSSAQFNLAG